MQKRTPASFQRPRCFRRHLDVGKLDLVAVLEERVETEDQVVGSTEQDADQSNQHGQVGVGSLSKIDEKDTRGGRGGAGLRDLEATHAFGLLYSRAPYR